MKIRTYQAETLAELLSKIRDMYGPNTALLSVRRVPCRNTLGYMLEGSVAIDGPAPSAEKAPNSAAIAEQLLVEPNPVRVPAKRSHLPNLGLSGLIALVGPMGAGKTTTAAKIAGRLARESNDPVGLISTDTERPGGSALLTSYAAELGLMATTASSASDLQNRIARWNCRGPLVIDTRGCGPRDSLAIERLENLLKNAGNGLQRYLVLSATEHPSVARESLINYGAKELSGVILTRVDQAAGIGHAVEEIRKCEVELTLLGTGERVPEDLMRPTESSLQALQPRKPAFAS
jgi:flagellar biosynthesis protein FlhF